MDFLRTTALLLRLHLGTVLRSRRALVCLVLAAIPPLLTALAVNIGPDVRSDELVSVLAWHLSLQVIVPLLALIAGSAVVTEEVESRTITFLFTRPIPRSALLFGRWLATLILISTLLGGSALIVVQQAGDPADETGRREIVMEDDDFGAEYRQHRDSGGSRSEWRDKKDELRAERERVRAAGAVQLSPDERAELFASAARRLLLASLLGGAVYSLVFAVLGVFLKHPMIVGLGYAFAIEGVLSNLPGKTQSMSLLYWIRGLIVDDRMPIWKEIYPFPLDTLPARSDSLFVLGMVGLVALLLGAWGITRKQFVLTS